MNKVKIEIEIPDGYQLKYPEMRVPENGDSFISVMTGNIQLKETNRRIIVEKCKWTPAKGEEFWSVNDTGKVRIRFASRGLVKAGNYYPSREAAEIVAEKIKQIHKEAKGEIHGK